ncbi:MAG TPA: protease complex subunit PrcB family protein [Vicinamibacterales bacterium]|nr:protease complex subunit PrcB family protein [Vicinamibacterales bacterium]
MAGKRLILWLLLAQAVVSTSISFTTVAQGGRSQIQEPRQVVVRTAADWQTLWTTHDSAPAPTVDFSRVIVVGVFLGTRPTAGFSVRITAVTAKETSAVVEYVEGRPRAGAMTAQVITSPFHLVSVPRKIETVEFKKIEK